MKHGASGPRRALVSVLGLVVLSLVAVSVQGDGASERTPSKARIGEFTLVYNVNNGGYIDVCGCIHKKVRNGSLTRRSSFIKQLRGTGRELLILDGGSALFAINEKAAGATREDEIGKARLIVEAYNRMGYRAMALGTFDIAMGVDTLKELVAGAKFDVLSANFVDVASGKPVFEPHAIYTVGGVRVGVVGLTLETMGSAYLATNAPGIRVTDPLEAAKKAVSELSGKTDLIIALSHIKPESNYELIRQLSQIGVVVDPFIEIQSPRTWIKEEEWLGVLDETLFLRSDGQGARLGVLDITVDNSGAKLHHRYFKEQIEAAVRDGTATDEQRAQLAIYQTKNTYDFQRVSIGPHHNDDPDIDKLVEEWKKGIDPSKVAHLEKSLPMRDVYMTTEKCSSCHEKQHEFWKTTRHANAMASLKKTGDHLRYDCVTCHSLGYGTAYLDTSAMGAFAEVQCESCHGARPGHDTDPANVRFGPVAELTCLGCHNKDHTLKDFQFVSMRRNVACPKG